MSVYRNLSVLSLVVAGLAVACTQSVGDPNGGNGTQSSALGGAPVLVCEPVAGPADGVIVKLNGILSPRGSYCPTVGGRQGVFTDRWIAWEESNTSTCVGACQGLPVRTAVPAEYGAEWNDPNLTSPSADYCMWFMSEGQTYRELTDDILSELNAISPLLYSEQWPHYSASISACPATTQPGQGSCAGCGGPKY